MHDHEIAPDPHDRESSPPTSKSQRKRDATALRNLGEQLVDLTPAQLRRIPLPDDVLEAVRVAQTISQRGGRKRQLQYIGKLMRQIDDPEAIRAALRAVLPGWNHGRSQRLTGNPRGGLG